MAADGTQDAAWMGELLMKLCAVDSTTGTEDRLLPVLEEALRALGARVERIEAAPGRHDLLALFGEPEVLFSTHLDTVPPFIAPRAEADAFFGRGTCDAKGQIVAQLAAIRRLRDAGATALAWLGVVGEETDSIGAEKAKEALAGRFPRLRAVIDGEPTENRLATGQRGALSLRLRCRGRSAHSGTPERGRSAIWPLLEWLMRLRELPGREDQDLGPEIWNLGRITGGRAPNVVPDLAEADLLVRALPGSSFVRDAQALRPEEGEVAVLYDTPADRFPRVEGFEHAVVPFGSDAPRLRRLAEDGTVVLAGPGSIEVAHGPDEHITRRALTEGAALNQRLARHFLESS